MKFLFIEIISSCILFLSALVPKPPPYGQLKITGKYLTKLDGTPVQLRGVSLMESNSPLGSQYFNNMTANFLKCFWNANVVRAPLGLQNWTKPGYFQNASFNYQLLADIIDTAIENGIYVIVDWHAFEMYEEEAVRFFTKISKDYGSYPHILYETFNEPQWTYSWKNLTAYHIRIINAIRENDPDNVIVVGTPRADKDVDVAARNPITMTNIAYSLHHYTNLAEELMNKTVQAINLGLPIFASETGVCDWSGNGTYNSTVSQAWWKLLDKNHISYTEFGLADYPGDCNSFLQHPTRPWQLGNRSTFSDTGVYVYNKLWSTDQGIVCSSG